MPRKKTEKEELIVKAQKAYQKGEPIMSDAQFDALTQEEGEEELCDYEGGKVKHDIPMLSQNKCHDVNKAAMFAFGCSETLFFVTLKVDGFACSLLYNHGKLVQASTRGNGSFGEDITKTVMAYVDGVPKELKDDITAEIRGEIFCKKDPKDPNQNWRNIAVGMCKRKEIIEDERRLNFVVWDVVTPMFEFEVDKPKFANEHGFVFVPFCAPVMVTPALKNTLEEYYNNLRDYADRNDIPADGIVIKCNSRKRQLALGNTAHHPKSSIALKFQPPSIIAKVLKITKTVGKKTGKITPVAHIEPVILDGARIEKVSLGSEDVMQSLGIKAGCKVVLQRSGGVIPHIIGVI